MHRGIVRLGIRTGIVLGRFDAAPGQPAANKRNRCGNDQQEYSLSGQRRFHDFPRLLYEHDAKYFATNLSPKALPGYPPNHQKYVIASLTKLGVPTAPVKLAGSVSYGSDPGAQDPKARFTSHVVYPADAHFYLDIARRNGLWQIDLFSFGWQDKPSPRPAPSL